MNPTTQTPSQATEVQPPQWLLRLIDYDAATRRLTELRSRERDAGLEQSTDEPAEMAWLATYIHLIEREKNVVFERKWGVVYLPIALVIVAWLLLMSIWDKL